MPLPRGTVTFLFTDIEDSTGLVRRLGDEYGRVLADHRTLLRDAVAAGGGTEVDARGDELFTVFPERPLFNLPRFISCIARFTFFEAPFE